MKIEVNSAACGTGKTQQDLIPRAINKLANKQKVLVIQPSHALVKKTCSDIKNCLPNHAPEVNRVFAIYGDKKTQEVNALLDTQEPTILVTTHAIFAHLRSDVPKGWTLYIDEEIQEAFKFFRIKQKSFKLDIDGLFEFDSINISEALPKMDAINELLSSESTILESKTIRETLLSAKSGNFTTYFKHSEEMLFIYRVIKAERFNCFDEVQIYCAKFEDSIMCHVLTWHGFEIVIRVPFEKHKAPMALHYAKNPHISKKAIENNPCALKQFDEYVSNNTTDTYPLRLSNVVNRDGDNNVWLNINCHGANTYTEHEDVVLDMALIPHYEEKVFLEAILCMNEQAILQARMGSIYYQSIMRCCLRNPNNHKTAKVFILSENLKDMLLEYFDNPKLSEMDGCIFEVKKNGRPIGIDENAKRYNKEYRSKYQRANRWKKKNGISDMSTKDVIEMDEFKARDLLKNGKKPCDRPNHQNV